jgi:hypothetical protein
VQLERMGGLAKWVVKAFYQSPFIISMVHYCAKDAYLVKYPIQQYKSGILTIYLTPICYAERTIGHPPRASLVAPTPDSDAP